MARVEKAYERLDNLTKPRRSLGYLEELAARTHLWIEYGLQSAHDRTLELINRGHTFAEFEDAVKALDSVK